MTPEELRLELACALYARGKLTKVRGAELATPVNVPAFPASRGQDDVRCREIY